MMDCGTWSNSNNNNGTVIELSLCMKYIISYPQIFYLKFSEISFRMQLNRTIVVVRLKELIELYHIFSSPFHLSGHVILFLRSNFIINKLNNANCIYEVLFIITKWYTRSILQTCEIASIFFGHLNSNNDEYNTDQTYYLSSSTQVTSLRVDRNNTI